MKLSEINSKSISYSKLIDDKSFQIVFTDGVLMTVTIEELDREENRLAIFLEYEATVRKTERVA